MDSPHQFLSFGSYEFDGPLLLFKMAHCKGINFLL